jgi:acetylornithine deacetylase
MRTATDWLAELVSFDTTSRNSNLALIDRVEAYLAGLGAVCHRIASPDGKKANLHAVLGPDVDGGVVLSGHTDVVPVDGQDWSSDPFTLTERDGKLYARGSLRHEGLYRLRSGRRRRASPRPVSSGPCISRFPMTRKSGCLGAPDMIAQMAGIRRVRLASSWASPPRWQVMTGHKGLFSVRVEVFGKEAHSSRWWRTAPAPRPTPCA